MTRWKTALNPRMNRSRQPKPEKVSYLISIIA